MNSGPLSVNPAAVTNIRRRGKASAYGSRVIFAVGMAVVQGAFPAQLIAILLAAHMLLCTGAPVFTQRRFPARFLDDPVPADLLGNCGWIFSNEHSDFLKFHAALQCLFNINPVRKS